MADKQQRSESVWERLKRNRDRNTRLFNEAGVRPESSKDVICPACGAEESAIFWSVTSRKRMKLHLLCPVCEQARVAYSLARNRPVDPVFTRGSVGGGLGMVAVLLAMLGLFHFRESPPVQMVGGELHNLAGALSSRMSRTTGSVGGSGSTTSARPSTGENRSTGGSSGVNPSTSSGRFQSAGSSGTRSGPSSSPSAGPSPGAVRLAGAPTSVVVEAAEAAPPTRAYVSRGDRRADLDIYAARIIDQFGEREARRLLTVEYDPEANLTRVVVDPSSTQWPRHLTWLRGWRTSDPG